jgi:translation initiation factor 2 subunit 1
MLQYAFQDVVEKDLSLEKLGLEKSIAKKLEKLVNERIKPKEVTIGGKLKLTIYAENGLELIKKTLIKADDVQNVTIKYLGGGAYGIEVKAPDYKKAEKILKTATEGITKEMEKAGGEATFTKTEK